MFTLPDHPLGKLQQAVSQTTGFTAQKETRQTDALLLKIKDPALLAHHVSKKGTKTNYKFAEGIHDTFNFPISNTVNFLEGVFQKPIVGDPSLSGYYDFAFRWQDPQQKEAALNRELEEAGLELMPTNTPIEMLIVEKAN
jgi:uncharacterized protein (TIGR03435 family)